MTIRRQLQRIAACVAPARTSWAAAMARHTAALDAWEAALLAGTHPGPLPPHPYAWARETPHDWDERAGSVCVKARFKRIVGPVGYLLYLTPAARAYCDHWCGFMWSSDREPFMAGISSTEENPFPFPEWAAFAALAGRW